jgi:hypothetical protein
MTVLRFGTETVQVTQSVCSNFTSVGGGFHKE